MDDPKEDTRDMCKYGVDCYQKNPEHHRKYKHPKRKSDEDMSRMPKKNKMDPSSSKEFCSDKTGTSESKEIDKSDNEQSSSNSTVASNEVKDANFLDLPTDIRFRIETVFLVKMPEDFFSFFEFCKSLNKLNPYEALLDTDLRLVGPFDLLERDLKPFTLEEGLRHYRYFYDPPEFQTVLTSKSKPALHYGYYRDNPKDLPAFIGSNDASIGCTIEIVGSNIFSACNRHLDKIKKISDPFRKMKLQKIQNSLTEWCKSHNYTIDTYTKTSRERKGKIVTKTFHGAGIIVPFDKKNELGYRELKENDKDLIKILQDISEAKSDEVKNVFWSKLDTVITYANIANDESDFGTSLELGIDLFCFGSPEFHKTILNILSTSYELLGRSEFATILKAHLNKRLKGCELNTIVK